MTATLIIIGIFAGFFFLVVRPLQKRSGKYNVEMPEEDIFTDSTFRNMPGNIFHHDD